MSCLLTYSLTTRLSPRVSRSAIESGDIGGDVVTDKIVNPIAVHILTATKSVRIFLANDFRQGSCKSERLSIDVVHIEGLRS